MKHRSAAQAAHAYKAQAYHVHSVASKRRPGYEALVRCTRQACKSTHEVTR